MRSSQTSGFRQSIFKPSSTAWYTYLIFIQQLPVAHKHHSESTCFLVVWQQKFSTFLLFCSAHNKMNPRKQVLQNGSQISHYMNSLSFPKIFLHRHLTISWILLSCLLHSLALFYTSSKDFWVAKVFLCTPKSPDTNNILKRSVETFWSHLKYFLVVSRCPICALSPYDNFALLTNCEAPSQLSMILSMAHLRNHCSLVVQQSSLYSNVKQAVNISYHLFPPQPARTL